MRQQDTGGSVSDLKEGRREVIQQDGGGGSGVLGCIGNRCRQVL